MTNNFIQLDTELPIPTGATRNSTAYWVMKFQKSRR